MMALAAWLKRKTGYVAMVTTIRTGHLLAKLLAGLARRVKWRPRRGASLLLYPYTGPRELGYQIRYGILARRLPALGRRVWVAEVPGSDRREHGVQLPYYEYYWYFALVFIRRFAQVLRSCGAENAYVQRSLFPGYPGQTRDPLMELLVLMVKRVWVDFYDADFVASPDLIDGVARLATGVTVSHEFLAEHFRPLSREVRTLPIAIDVDAYAPRSSWRIRGAPQALWFGSPSNLRQLEAFVAELSQTFRHLGVILAVMCPQRPEIHGLPIEWQQWSPEGARKALATADFGLYVSDDSTHSRGKQAYKVLEYLAAGLPTIGSPWGQADGLIHGKHILTAVTPLDWQSALGQMCTSETLRTQLAQEGRDFIRRFHSEKAYAKQVDDIFFGGTTSSPLG